MWALDPDAAARRWKVSEKAVASAKLACRAHCSETETRQRFLPVSGTGMFRHLADLEAAR